MAGEEDKTQGDNLEKLDGRDFVPADDRAEPVAETRERQEAPEARQEEEPAKPKEGSPFDAKRNSIVEKLRAQRDQNDRNPSIDIPPEMERQQVGPHVATREDRNRPPAAAAVEELKPENVPAPRRITLKVNGEDREYDEDQVINYARIAVASQDALNEAKRERDVAREERQRASEELAEIRRLRAIHSPDEGRQPAPAQVKAEDSKPATDEELDSLIEAIQTGEIEDAKKALLQYGDQIERRIQGKIGDIDQRISASIRQQQEDARVQNETNQVISSFAAENDDLASSDMRMKVLIDEVVEVQREKLRTLNVSDDQITQVAQHYKIAPAVAIGRMTRFLREKGHEIPDNAAIMREAATRVRQGFGLPDPAVRQQPAPVVDPTPSIVAERIERKQAMAPQPRRANVTPGADAAPAKTQDQRRADAVAHMRAFRRGR